MRAFVYFSGDPNQIQVLLEAEIQELLRTTLVDLGKIPASCNNIYQSSNVNKNIWVGHHAADRAQYRPNVYQNVKLCNRLTGALAKSLLAPEFQKRVVDGLQVCTQRM